MLSERACSVRYALRRGRRFGEIGARRLLVQQRLSERDAVRAHARLRRLGDLGAREIHERKDGRDPEQPGDEDDDVLSAVASYSSGGHRRLRCAEGDDRSRRGAGGFAEEDEDDDGEEGDEESFEVEKDVLEQHQRAREPGVALRGFAQSRSELDESRIHRQQQPEYGEVRGELRDRQDSRKNPEAERALENAIVPDPRIVGLLELPEAVDLCPSGRSFAISQRESIHLCPGFADQPVEICGRGLDLILHFDSNAPAPLPEQLETFHPEHLFGLEDADAFDIVAWQTFLRPFGGKLRRFLLYKGELAIEPIVGLFCYCVDAVPCFQVVVERVLLRKRIPERRVSVPELPQSSNPAPAQSGLAIAVRGECGGMVGSIATKPTTYTGIGRRRGTDNVGHGFSATKG